MAVAKQRIMKAIGALQISEERDIPYKKALEMEIERTDKLYENT